MTTLQERLRAIAAVDPYGHTGCIELFREAADALDAQAARIAELEGLLREWRETADYAKDMTFVPVAKRTDAFLSRAGEPAPRPEP